MSEIERLKGQIDDLNREMRELIYVTSHDLRAPLINIEGFSKELRKSYHLLLSLQTEREQNIPELISPDIQQEIEQAFDFIDKSVAKMYLLVNSLLQLSRLIQKETDFSLQDINLLLDSVIRNHQSLFSEKDIQLEKEILNPCQGDQFQLQQLFSLLIENALKFLPPGCGGKISIRSRSEGNEVVYTVADNGPGIEPFFQVKVFNAFYQIKPIDTPGVGMGLYLAKKIVEKHKGRLWLKSQTGEGSCFYIALPAGGKDT